MVGGGTSGGYQVYILDVESFTISILGAVAIPPELNGEVAVLYGAVGPEGDYVVLSWVQSTGPFVMAKYSLSASGVALVNYTAINQTGFVVPVLLNSTNVGFYMAEKRLEGSAILTNFDFAAWKRGAAVTVANTTIFSETAVVAVGGDCIFTANPSSTHFDMTQISQYLSSTDLQVAQKLDGQVLFNFTIYDYSPMIASSGFLYVPVTTFTDAFIVRWETIC